MYPREPRECRTDTRSSDDCHVSGHDPPLAGVGYWHDPTKRERLGPGGRIPSELHRRRSPGVGLHATHLSVPHPNSRGNVGRVVGGDDRRLAGFPLVKPIGNQQSVFSRDSHSTTWSKLEKIFFYFTSQVR